MTQPEANTTSRHDGITRRKFLIGAGSTLGAAGLAALAARSPTDAAKKEPQTGTGPATPNPLSATPIPQEVIQYAGDWPVAQGNLQSTRAAANSPINASNLSKLATAWTWPITATAGFGGMTCNPVVQGQVVYVQDMQSNVFALDRGSGKELWHTNFDVPSNGPNGVAVAYGYVYAATGDNSVAFALDAKTGKQVWASKLSNNNFECIDMAPLVYNNTVYISTNPNNTTYGNYRGGARGILYALDAATGVTLWSFDTAADNLWGAPRINSGAGLWYPPSVDDKGNLYFGTGNPAPYPGNDQYPNGTSRPGPNNYSDSLVSLDPNTGGVRWFINANPHDLYDHDLQESPVLATVTLNQTPTLMAFGSGKTGTVVAADANTGALLWKTDVGKHQNDQRQELPPGTTEIYPGTLGGIESPIAFGDNKIFAPYIDFPEYLTPSGAGKSTSGKSLADAGGGLAAIDAVSGDIVWDVKVNAIVTAGATVVNDVVLAPMLDGYLRAYDIKTGNKVWEMQTPAGVNAPLAVAGDTIIIAAAAPIFVNTSASAPGGASQNGATPAASTAGATPSTAPKITPEVVALKLGS
jgi:glucose dehydrogenase